MSMSQATPSPRRYRTTRDLTIAQQWLVRIISENQFGRIEDLRVVSGQSVLDKRLKVVRVARLGANGGRPKLPPDIGQ